MYLKHCNHGNKPVPSSWHGSKLPSNKGDKSMVDFFLSLFETNFSYILDLQGKISGLLPKYFAPNISLVKKLPGPQKVISMDLHHTFYNIIASYFL